MVSLSRSPNRAELFPPVHYPTVIAAGLSIGLALSDQALAAPNATVFLPAARPAFAEKLSQSLIGFSIEMDRWTSWAGEGVGKPNTYVNQMLSVMGSFTGVSPPFRVGGEYRSLSEGAVANGSFST